MKKRPQNSKVDPDDPLESELDFSKMKLVGLGPGWALVPKRLRSLKHMREARAYLKRKQVAPNSRRAA
jgi:hypothetical protein